MVIEVTVSWSNQRFGLFQWNEEQDDAECVRSAADRRSQSTTRHGGQSWSVVP